jgi:hypothetical protein
LEQYCLTKDVFPSDHKLAIMNMIKEVTGKDIKLANLPKDQHQPVCVILIYFLFPENQELIAKYF